MRHVARALMLPAALAAISVLPGCLVFVSHQTVKVRVVDAETDTPVPGAVVGFSNNSKMVLNSPWPVDATTDDEGWCKLRIGTYKDDLPHWSVFADGYLFYSDRSDSSSVFPRGAELVADSDGRPEAGIIRIYREPRPSYTVIVPVDFRGLVRIEVSEASGIPSREPGQREITLEIPPSGLLKVETTPLMLEWWLAPWRTSARFADGSPLTVGAPADGIALRLIPPITPNRSIWVVGTFEEGRAAYWQFHRRVVEEGEEHTVTDWAAIDALFSDEPGG